MNMHMFPLLLFSFAIMPSKSTGNVAQLAEQRTQSAESAMPRKSPGNVAQLAEQRTQSAESSTEAVEEELDEGKIDANFEQYYNEVFLKYTTPKSLLYVRPTEANEHRAFFRRIYHKGAKARLPVIECNKLLREAKFHKMFKRWVQKDTNVEDIKIFFDDLNALRPAERTPATQAMLLSSPQRSPTEKDKADEEKAREEKTRQEENDREEYEYAERLARARHEKREAYRIGRGSPTPPREQATTSKAAPPQKTKVSLTAASSSTATASASGTSAPAAAVTSPATPVQLTPNSFTRISLAVTRLKEAMLRLESAHQQHGSQ